MNKKVLAIYFSQTGQLRDIIDNFCAPLIEAGISVEKVNVRMQHDYPFPWTAASFFSVMPDCVLRVPAPIMPFELQEPSYDLIILGYQAWFLSPGIPFNSLATYAPFRNILKGTPVITVTGARNMWVNAFAGVKKILKETGSDHAGTIALVDKHLNLVSFVTIFHWLLRGRKDKYLDTFPKPGVSDEDIAHTKVFGTIVLQYLKKNNWEGLQQDLTANKAVDLKYHLMFIESKAGGMFKIWANFIAKRRNKKFWLTLFKYYLIIALFVAAPIVFVIDLLFFKPFLSKYIKAKKESVLKLN